MDMSFSTVCVYPSFSTRIATLFLVTYPFVLWALSRYRGDGIGPMAASAVPAALTPLFVAATAAWLGVASLVQGLSIAGGGRAVRAAGVSETLSMMTFGAAVTALVCTASWLADQIRKHRGDQLAPASIVVRVVSAAMVLFLTGLLVSHFAVAHHLVQKPGTHTISIGVTLTLASIAGLGGATSLLWLVLSRRRSTLQINAMRGLISALTAAAAGFIAYLFWHVTVFYRAIAMHG